MPLNEADWENYAGKEQAHVKCKPCTNLIRGNNYVKSLNPIISSMRLFFTVFHNSHHDENSLLHSHAYTTLFSPFLQKFVLASVTKPIH